MTPKKVKLMLPTTLNIQKSVINNRIVVARFQSKSCRVVNILQVLLIMTCFGNNQYYDLWFRKNICSQRTKYI